MEYTLPPMVLKTEHMLSLDAMRRLREQWDSYMATVHSGKPSLLVLERGVTIEPLNPQSIVPDAFCTYCGIANLSSSVWCGGCGAPMLRA